MTSEQDAGPVMPAALAVGTRVRDDDRRTGVVISTDEMKYVLPNSVAVRLDTKLYGHWNYWYRPEQLQALAGDAAPGAGEGVK